MLSPFKQFLYLSLLFVFLFPIISFAYEIFSPSGLSVEPAVSHISVGTENIYKGGLSVRNQGVSSLSFKISVNDFEQLDNGQIKLLDRKYDKDDPVFAASWFSIPNEVLVVPPKKKITIPYSVTIPNDASPGGRSIALVVETIDGNVHSRINSIVFLTVPGDTKESLYIIDTDFSPIITTIAKGYFKIDFKNEGKTHIRPQGNLIIKNMFGAKRGDHVLSEDNEIGIILPGGKKTVYYSWIGSMNILDFGLWSAKVDLKYGVENNHIVYDKVHFLVFPWKAILYIILIFGGSLYFFIYSIKKLKNKIEKSKNEINSNIEKELNFKLLIIPFISGLLLLVVVGITVYSAIEHKGGGEINKIQNYKNNT